MLKTSRLSLVLAAAGILLLANAGPGRAGDSPSGFYWGSDGSGPAPGSGASSCASSAAPWLAPNVSNNGCGRYGVYNGEVGGYWDVTGCGGTAYFNDTAANRANTNLYSYNSGVGTDAYWFAGGPGMDPHYDGTTAQANAWGVTQAKKAVAMANNHSQVRSILWMDVEEPGGGIYTGWNELMRAGSCGTVQSSSACCSTAVDRATVNGFRNYIYSSSSYWPGYYSTSGEWSGIFGTGSDATVTNTMEWTANYGQNCRNPAPSGWTQAAGSCSSNSAKFFGTVGTGDNCAVAWQWSGGSNDYDQYDSNRELLCQ